MLLCLSEPQFPHLFHGDNQVPLGKTVTVMTSQGWGTQVKTGSAENGLCTEALGKRLAISITIVMLSIISAWR